MNVLTVTALQTRIFLIFLGSCRKQVFIAYLFFIKTYCYHRGCFQWLGWYQGICSLFISEQDSAPAHRDERQSTCYQQEIPGRISGRPAVGGGFKAESFLGHIIRNVSSPLPSPPSPLLTFSFASPPLEVGPLNAAMGSGGAPSAPPAGSGAEPQSKSNLVHFSLKINNETVATICMIFLRINWTNFMQFEH